MNFSSFSSKGKRAVIYTRVSTDEQAKTGYSLRAQQEQLQKWCQIQDLEIVAHFQDDASAKTFNRPEFKKLLKFVKQKSNSIDYLLVVKWDRFSRNQLDALQMLKTLEKLGVTVQAIEQTIDFSIPENKAMLSFYLTIPEIENDRRGLNTRSGMRKANKEGRWVHRAPKGYKFVPDTEKQGKSKLVFDENATLIKEAFELASLGTDSVDNILRKMTKKGFKCSKTYFHGLLRNIIYIGKIKIPAWKDEPEEIVSGIHEGIISENLFYKVQEVLDGKQKVHIRGSSNEELYPLKTSLSCSVCNKNLTASSPRGRHGKKFPYYHCANNRCKVRTLVRKIDVKFLEILSSFKVSQEAATLYYRIFEDYFKSQNKDKKSQISKIDEEISELKSRLLKIDKKFFDEEIEKDSYERLKKDCQESLKALQIKKSEMSSVERDYKKYLAFGFSLLVDLVYYFEKAPVFVKQNLIKLLFKGKFILDEHGELRTPEKTEMFKLLTRFDEDFGEGGVKNCCVNGPDFPLGQKRVVRTPEEKELVALSASVDEGFGEGKKKNKRRFLDACSVW